MHGAGGTTSLSPGVGHLKLRARLAYWDHLPSQLHRIHKHNSDTAKAAEGRQLAILTGFCDWPAPLGACMTGRRVRYAGSGLTAGESRPSRLGPRVGTAPREAICLLRRGRRSRWPLTFGRECGSAAEQVETLARWRGL